MKEFFTTTIGAWDDGSVRLTAPGIAVVVVIIALLVVVAAVIRHRNAEKKTILTTKQLALHSGSVIFLRSSPLFNFLPIRLSDATLAINSRITFPRILLSVCNIHFSPILILFLLSYSRMPRYSCCKVRVMQLLDILQLRTSAILPEAISDVGLAPI